MIDNGMLELKRRDWLISALGISLAAGVVWWFSPPHTQKMIALATAQSEVLSRFTEPREATFRDVICTPGTADHRYRVSGKVIYPNDYGVYLETIFSIDVAIVGREGVVHDAKFTRL